MHAYLIVGDNSNIDTKIKDLCKNHEAKSFEFPLNKVQDVRELIKFTKYSLEFPTAIIIRNIDLATQEACNAFLKNLEEPQEKLVYILTADNEYKVLPTISSRCQIIKTRNVNPVDEKFALNFITKKIGARLSEVSKIKERSEAIRFVEELILSLDALMANRKTTILQKYKVVNFISISQFTLNALKANGNLVLQLSNLAINFGRENRKLN